MNKIWVLSVLVIMKCTAQVQQEKKTYLGDTNNLSVNKFLDGYAWVYEKNDNHPNASQNFRIFYENKTYIISNVSGVSNSFNFENIIKYSSDYYCFFYRSPFQYSDSFKYDVYVPIPKDSVFFDMKINSIGMNVIFVLEDADKMPNPNIENLYGVMSYVISTSHPNYIERNRAWHPAPSTVGGMVRIIEPPKSIQDFIKYLRKDKKKATIRNKTIINESLTEQTKMYLLKGDEVEVLEESERSPEVEWLKIRYYGRKTIEGWIRKSDIE